MTTCKIKEHCPWEFIEEQEKLVINGAYETCETLKKDLIWDFNCPNQETQEKFEILIKWEVSKWN